MQHVQKMGFGTVPDWLNCAIRACYAYAKQADVHVSSAPAAGNAPQHGRQHANSAQPTRATRGIAGSGYATPGQMSQSNFAMPAGQKPGMNAGLGGFGVVGGMVGSLYGGGMKRVDPRPRYFFASKRGGGKVMAEADA